VWLILLFCTCDAQCEVCQAGVSWLPVLDHEPKVPCLPLTDEDASALESRLNLEHCLRQLHILTPSGDIVVGWHAVASLARLFPPTWFIGALGSKRLT